jgi:hypothetical protein
MICAEAYVIVNPVLVMDGEHDVIRVYVRDLLMVIKNDRWSELASRKPRHDHDATRISDSPIVQQVLGGDMMIYEEEILQKL